LLDFGSLITGALGGWLSGTALEWWKSSREDLTKLCDEFCGAIAEAGNAGAQYWLLPGSDEACGGLSARIYGLQRRINGYNALTCTRIHDEGSNWIEDELSNFYDALTGGEFGDPARKPDMIAARRTQDEAADAILAVRRGALETSSFRETAYRLVVPKRWRAEGGKARNGSRHAP
jgi:hypothetical protein